MQPCAHVAMSRHMLCLIPPPCSPYPKGPGMETAHGDTVFGVTVTPDGRSAVSAGMGFLGTDNTLRVWDLASGQCKKTLQVGGACMGPTVPPEWMHYPSPAFRLLPSRSCMGRAGLPVSLRCRAGNGPSAAALPQKRCRSGTWRAGRAAQSSR